MYRFLHCLVLFLMFSTTAFCGMQRTVSDALPFEDDEDTTMECFSDEEISKLVPVPLGILQRISAAKRRQLAEAREQRMERDRRAYLSRWKQKRDARRQRNVRMRNKRLNRKCVDLLEKTACSWVDRAMYMNEKGSVILDAKLCKKALENDIVATCVDCQETFKFCEIYEHYKKTNHRFFYNVRPKKG